MSEEETIESFKSLMYNAKANWDYFSYEILFNFLSLYNNVIEENKKLNEYKENYIPIQKIKDKIGWIQEEGYWLFTTDRDSDKCVEILQQLLEKE